MSRWIVANDGTVKRRDGTQRPTRSYWYGPTYGFGTASGPLADYHHQDQCPDYSVATFPTRKSVVR